MANEVLTSLDKAKTQWYHFTAIVIAGKRIFSNPELVFSKIDTPFFL